jgi:hypothetical protein
MALGPLGRSVRLPKDMESEMTRKLEKSEWSSFLNRISKGLASTQAEIEVTSLNLGDQI